MSVLKMDGAKQLETTVFQVLVDRGLGRIPLATAKLEGGGIFYSNWYPLGSIHHYQSTIARS
jgi:hypothetical protein